MRIGDINPLVPAGFDIAWSLIVVAVVATLAAFILAAVWSIMSSPRLTGSGRVLWIVVVLAMPILGTAAWFAWGRSVRLDRGLS